jgi:hypothetical protein
VRRVRPVLALIAAVALGCTVTTESVGPRLLFDGSNVGLGMRAEAVVEAFGVPDEIESRLHGFGFVYRFVHRDEERLQIGSYGFKLVTNERAELQQGALELFFDAGGRLVGKQLRDAAAGAAE